MSTDKEGLGAFQGVFPALCSPCDDKDALLEDQLARLIRDLLACGVHGLYVGGMTGSGYRMRLDERKLAVEIAVAEANTRDSKVIVHVGSMGTREAIDLAEHAASAGAHAVASLPPPHAGPHQQASYYRELAHVASLPLFLYYYSALDCGPFSFEALKRFLEIPGVAGLKITDWNLFTLRQLKLWRPDLTIFSGFDQIFFPALLYGADGGIGTWGNLFPAVFVAIYQTYCQGDCPRAMNLQKSLLDFFDVVARHDREAAFEFLLNRRGIGPHSFRRPRAELDSGDRIAMERDLTEAASALEASTAICEPICVARPGRPGHPVMEPRKP